MDKWCDLRHMLTILRPVDNTVDPSEKCGGIAIFTLMCWVPPVISSPLQSAPIGWAGGATWGTSPVDNSVKEVNVDNYTGVTLCGFVLSHVAEVL